MILICCEIFADELKACLDARDGTRIVWIEAALHADPKLLEARLEQAIQTARETDPDVRLLYGRGCHPDLPALMERFGVKTAAVKNCIEAFCRERTRELEANRTMVMTPGWVRAWPKIMEVLGWDEVDVRINLGRYDRILLLDAGIHPLSDDEIITFFDLVQVPIEMQPLDLADFRKTLAATMAGP